MIYIICWSLTVENISFFITAMSILLSYDSLLLILKKKKPAESAMKVIMLTEPQNEVTMDRNVFKKVNRKEEERLSHFQDFPETI